MSTEETMRALTLADFSTMIVYRPSIFDEAFRRRKTVRDVERDVAKLKSVSEAGRAWIADERCSWLSIGRHEGVLRQKRKA